MRRPSSVTSLRLPLFSLLLSLSLTASLAAQSGGGGPRYGLVIGNSAYTGMPPLRNPANDARDVAAALRKLGFTAEPRIDLTRKQMNQAIMAFRESLSSDRQSEGFFYYAGHAIQSKGVNYLIPVGTDIRSEADLEDEAVNLQRVLGSLEEARNRVNVVVLDACRDNPLPASSRSASRGLAVVASAPPQTVVLFSTAQNQTAADGEGRNSPFAAALVKYLSEPGDISRTVKLVTAEVKRVTRGAQTPFQYSSLDLEYNLNRASSGATASSVPSTSVPDKAPRVLVTPAAKAYGAIKITAKTAGTLYIDGTKVGSISAGDTARLDDVEAGKRRIELRYADRMQETAIVKVPTSGSVSIDFTYVATPVAASSPVERVPGESIRGEVFVKGGVFRMGSDAGNDAGPVHEVRVSDFWIMKTEVNQRDYNALMMTNPSRFKGDSLPVECVNWYDAVTFANKLSAKDGLRSAYSIQGKNVSCDWDTNGWRLPTEAEWEYAARGGTASKGYTYAGSDDIDSVAWYNRTTNHKGTKEVGTKAANELGLYDMSGNVWEWCWDWWGEYRAGMQVDPRGDSSGPFRVYRGGSWDRYASDAWVAGRHGGPPELPDVGLGFRLVRRP